MNHKAKLAEFEQRLLLKEPKTTWTKTADGFKVEFERDNTYQVTELRINGIEDI